eukprot:TRINITY_DN5140_c0_g1_i3.p1 TRINITY_DN5140_c0_g1~~TRINITY_DN5140_c0_g1_i3.p1  ORF type:complete len:605 (+),score=88.74 TRINITY_DN5140_c0_g1_i3:41-1816(+)
MSRPRTGSAYDYLLELHNRNVSPMRRVSLASQQPTEVVEIEEEEEEEERTNERPAQPDKENHMPYCNGKCGGKCMGGRSIQHADFCNGKCNGRCLVTMGGENWEETARAALFRIRRSLPAGPRDPPEVIDPAGPVFEFRNVPKPSSLQFEKEVIRAHQAARRSGVEDDDSESRSDPQGSPPPPPASVVSQHNTMEVINLDSEGPQQIPTEPTPESNQRLAIEAEVQGETPTPPTSAVNLNGESDKADEVTGVALGELRTPEQPTTTGEELRRSTAAFRRTLELLQSEVQMVLSGHSHTTKEDPHKAAGSTTPKSGGATTPPKASTPSPKADSTPPTPPPGPVYNLAAMGIKNIKSDSGMDLFSESLAGSTPEESEVPTERRENIKELCEGKPADIEERHSSPAVTHKQPWKVLQWQEDSGKKWGCKAHDKEYTAWCYEEGCNVILCADCMSMEHVGHTTLPIPDKKEMDRKLEQIKSGASSAGKELLLAPERIRENYTAARPNAHPDFATFMASLESDTAAAFSNIDEQLNYLTGKLSVTKDSWPTVSRRVKHAIASPSSDPPPLYGAGMTPIAREHQYLSQKAVMDGATR